MLRSLPKNSILALLFALVAPLALRAADEVSKELSNPIQVAVPILNIAPEARGAGMGDMGVATSPDVNSQHWNAAKYPFAMPKMGIGLSYIPWLQNLVNDVNLYYLSLYYRVDKTQSVSGSLRYFGLGSMAIVDEGGQTLDNVDPKEFAFDVAYARKFGSHLSGALTLRYIRSDLTGGFVQSWGYGGLTPANGFGADVAMYYENEHNANSYAFGGVISNLGTKLSYSDNAEKYFLPTDLRLGGRYTFVLDESNAIMLGLELSKLLVPTPPVTRTINGERDVLLGMENLGVDAIEGLAQSFYDAPYGLKEELSEIMLALGTEYAYNNLFFARGGYFHDSKRKGNRRYLTFGAGIKYTFLSLDVSYLYAFTMNDPLQNTLRVSLSFDLNNVGRSNRSVSTEY